LVFEATGVVPEPTSDVREVENYVRALEFGFKRLDTLPLSLRFIRELHKHLMAGVRGGKLAPGEFRTSQNWIGSFGVTLAQAIYVPPPVAEMRQGLNDFELYLHAASDLPPLVRLALIHYQFEALHPFLDGNGRVGRLLISLLLYTEGLLRHPLLNLSAFFERQRQEYYDHLLAVSRAARWNEWIEFFVQGVQIQALDAMQRTERLLALWQSYRHKLQAERSSILTFNLLDQLFSNPALTATQIAAELGISYMAATNNIERLVNAGILVETTGKARNRIFLAREIMQILESPNA
jgi:Fic family protein